MDICLEGDHFGTDMGATPLVNPPLQLSREWPPHTSYPIIQPAGLCSQLLNSHPPRVVKTISFSHLQCIEQPLKIAVFPLFLFLPKVCSLQQAQWEHNHSGCSCNLSSVQPPPTLCLCGPLFWNR